MKIKVMILLLALSLFCAGAEAMNYKPYECFYEMDGPSLLYGEHDTFSCSWGNANGDIRLPWHLFWRKDGQVYRDYAYDPQQEDFGHGTVFLPIDEETCHVLQKGTVVWAVPL